jgi:ribosomal protein S18 acetylase RimI-like enzyme
MATLRGWLLKTIIKSKLSQMVKHLGLKGIVASILFKAEFEQISGDLMAANDTTACIDFIATLPEFRGQGVASELINHICSLPQYREFLILNVVDTNIQAVRLYERLGFTEFRRVEKHYPKRVGINAYLSFRKKTE